MLGALVKGRDRGPNGTSARHTRWDRRALCTGIPSSPPLYETFAFITRMEANLSPATEVLIRLARQLLKELPESIHTRL